MSLFSDVMKEGTGCVPGLQGGYVCPGSNGPFDKGLHPLKPNIDPTCLGVDCQPPAPPPNPGNGGSTTGGSTTSPLDSLAAQLMGGGSGGGLTAAPVTVPASSSGSSLLLVALVVGVGVLGYLFLKRKKGGDKK